jgi:predicted nucleic acid-binding protein
MATISDSFLVDTNVVVRWAQPGNALHRQCLSAVEGLTILGGTPCVVPQNMIEMWNALTRPLVRNGFGLKPVEADAVLKQVELRFRLLDDVPEVYRTLRRLVVEAGVSGVQVHDARLAACMLAHGIPRILAFNAPDFARYAGITPVHPKDVDAR